MPALLPIVSAKLRFETVRHRTPQVFLRHLTNDKGPTKVHHDKIAEAPRSRAVAGLSLATLSALDLERGLALGSRPTPTPDAVIRLWPDAVRRPRRKAAPVGGRPNSTALDPGPVAAAA